MTPLYHKIIYINKVIRLDSFGMLKALEIYSYIMTQRRGGSIYFPLYPSQSTTI